ncbi:hypothetical protein DFH06DRAFT_1008444, partial [Mycena polygramma]
TNEVAGVLPIPEDVRIKSGMSQFESSLHSKQRHHYLAALQGTRKPVLPIHSTPEKDLFRDLMAKSPGSFSSPSSIDNMVRLWNSHADEKKDIYYKLSEQLKVYFNGNWKTNANIKQSKAMTAEARTPLNTRLRDPFRLLAAPNIPSSQLAPHRVRSGMLSLFDEPENSPQDNLHIPHSPHPDNSLSMPISYSAISSGSATPSVIASTHFIAGSSSARHDNSDTTRDQTYTGAPSDAAMPSVHAHFAAGSSATGPSAPTANVVPPSQYEILQQLARNRMLANLPREPVTKPRKIRTCRKCGIATCKGKRGWTDCTNKCRDCGKSGSDLSCKGRNPNKPLLTCQQVEW